MSTKLFFILTFCLFSFFGKAQFVDFGQDPAFLRWKQINTENFQIIYPDFFEENAQKIANIYDVLYKHSNSLQQTPAKISMIIHTNGGISNGSVAWAPKRSDLYTVPQQAPSDSWLEHLCVHEFRHVVQIDKVNQGLTKILYYIFGEQVTIAVTGIYLPMWFMEGDAVTFETAIGHLGRGRSPEFLNEMKAQIVEKGIYSYYKAFLGSDKDYVPNRYTVGYFMVGNSRVNYGNEIWANALQRIGRHPFGITPFRKSLQLTLNAKRDSLWNTHHFQSLFINADSVKKANAYKNSKRTLYHDNFSELQAIWRQEVQDAHSSFDTVDTRNTYYASYYYPVSTEDNSIVAYKKGLRQTGAFVLLKDGKETLLTRTGTPEDNKFAYRNNLLVWTEYRPNIRWENGGRIVLASYDRVHKKYRRYKSSYNRFSPFIAGNNWGIVEVDNDNRASIVILDPSLKHELQRIQANQDELFIHPSCSNDTVYTAVQTTKGIRIEAISLQSGKRETIISPQYYELDNPIRKGNSLLFRASFNSNNSVYRKDLSNDSIHQILEAPFGLRFPALNAAQDSLYFSFYTSDGYKPGKASIQSLTNKPLEKEPFRLADSLSRIENWKYTFNADSLFPSKRYSKNGHLFNIHSWGPLYIDQYDMKTDIGLIVYSQNKLSTLSLAAGYILDSDYDHGAWVLNATYKGLWPIFSLDVKSGRYDYYNFNTNAHNLNTGLTDTLYLNTRSQYTHGEFTMKLPFNLSVKNYTRSLAPYIRYKLAAIHHNRTREAYQYTERSGNAILSPINIKDYSYSNPANYYQILEYGITFTNQTRMTAQEISPRWGQTIQAGYAHTPLKKIDAGHEWWASTSLYFPGFAVNHSFSAYTGYQSRPKGTFYDKEIFSPSGIKLHGDKLMTLKTNYKLPLLFPDQHITSLFYIKRVDGGVFFDMGRDKMSAKTYKHYSYGVELTAGFHFLSLPFPINAGIRTGYETQTKSVFTNFLFSVSLNY